MVFDKNMLDDFIDSETNMVIDEIQPVSQNDAVAIGMTVNGVMMVDMDKVYSELNNLVITAKDLLETTKFIMDNDITGESIAGAARMIDTIRQLIKEFSSIHTANLKFEQQKEMEMLKQENREKLIKLRNPPLDPIDEDDESVTLQAYNQEDAVRKIIEMRNK